MTDGLLCVVVLFTHGEFYDVQVCSTQEKAHAIAARHIHSSFGENFIASMSLDNGEDDLREWMGNMQEMFRLEAYEAFVENWDAYAADGDYNGPSLANFLIEWCRLDQL